MRISSVFLKKCPLNRLPKKLQKINIYSTCKKNNERLQVLLPLKKKNNNHNNKIKQMDNHLINFKFGSVHCAKLITNLVKQAEIVTSPRSWNTSP